MHCPECPVSHIEPGLAIYFTYGNIHVSVLFSQIIPPSPSPTAFGFEGQWGLTAGAPHDWGNRGSILKGHTQGKNSHLIGAWVRPTCWSWRVSLRREGHCLALLGARGSWQPCLGVHPPRHQCGGGGTRWDPPSSSLVPRSSPAQQPAGVRAGAPQAKQPF